MMLCAPLATEMGPPDQIHMGVTTAAIKACPTAFASVAAECGMQPPASLRRQDPITSSNCRGRSSHLHDTFSLFTAQDTTQT